MNINTKFNEWVTQNKDKDFSDLSSVNGNLGMTTREDLGLVESQLEQWVDRLMGLVHALPAESKHRLIEKVIKNIQSKSL